MSDFGCGIAVGIFVGFLLGMAVGSYEADEARTACEKELPRNQQCVIIAVPEQDKVYD